MHTARDRIDTADRDHTTLSEQIVQFLLDRAARGLSPYTIRWYEQQLGHLRDLSPRDDAERLTPSDLRGILLAFGRDHNPGGTHGLWRAVRAFLRWCQDEYEWDHDAVRRVAAPRVPQKPLEGVDMSDLVAMLDTCERNTFHGERDRALMFFLLDTGLRRGEAVSLRVDDLDDGAVIVRRGKGGKVRTAFFGPTTALALRRYLAYRDPRPDDPLWSDERGHPLKGNAVNTLLRRRARQAGVNPPSPHDFRRAFALHILRQGADLISLQRLLGHSSLAVVERYLAQHTEDLRRVHRSASPVDRLLR